MFFSISFHNPPKLVTVVSFLCHATIYCTRYITICLFFHKKSPIFLKINMTRFILQCFEATFKHHFAPESCRASIFFKPSRLLSFCGLLLLPHLSFQNDVFLSDNSGGPCRVRQISLPVDISWLKATSACQYLLLVFACTPPGSNTVDYWRPLKAVLSCCPHSCYLADDFIVYMQMEVGCWASETIGS